MSKLDIETLNKPQYQAVTTTEGPVLVLAGAGSGKTRALTYRIAYLLDQSLAKPNEILAVTFTNKAAAEMKERVAQLVGSTSGLRYMPWMGTFHSICVRILRQHGGKVGLSSNFTIYDSGDQLQVVKQAFDHLRISQKDINPRAVQSHISSAKNEMVYPEQYASYAQGYFQEQVAEVYPVYQRILRENNSVDFDDILIKVVELLEKEPLVLAGFQEQFKYILVDEYQDTNHVQYLLVNKLAQQRKNICVVGDDDQSIYSFRGANIKNILNFERDYPEAAVIKLEQNYRSTEVILDAAFEVVSKNKNRTSKKLWTETKGGDKITLYTAQDEKDEAKWVARQIQSLTDRNIDPEDIAILYRTNAQSRAIEEEMLHQAINYRVVGGMRFYDRKEIKDIIAYLQVLHNPADDNGLQRIINVPRRGIGAKTVQDLAAAARAAGKGMAEFLLDPDLTPDNAKLKQFGLLLQRLHKGAQELSIVDLIDLILSRTKYLDMLNDGTPENEARVENLQELVSVASKYAEMQPAEALQNFLEEVALLESSSQQDGTRAAVTLMTIHAAKGLEFAHVFVVGMEEGLFPHSRVFNDPSEVEEERRLAYVAITRAKRNLYLAHADSRLYFGSRQQNMLSRFVEDIPPKLIERAGFAGREEWVDSFDTDWDSDFKPPELKSGDKVKHDYFGVGTVLEADDTIIKVNFGAIYGTRELARDVAPLQKV